MPAAGLPAACDRACRRRDARLRAARAARVGAGRARAGGGGGARPAVAPAHAARDDRLELPAARAHGQALFTHLAVFAGGFTAAPPRRCAARAARRSPRSSRRASSTSAPARGRACATSCSRSSASTRSSCWRSGGDWRRRHAEHYAGVAEAPEDEHPASRSGAAWQDLESEHDNFRAALDWSRASGEASLQLRIVGALAYFWATSDHLREGARGSTRRCGAPAARPRRCAPRRWRGWPARPQPRRLRADARVRAGEPGARPRARRRGHIRDRAQPPRDRAQQPRRHRRRHRLPRGERRDLAPARRRDALVVGAQQPRLLPAEARRARAARALFEDGLAVSREVGHRTGESVMLGNLGLAALLQHGPARRSGTSGRGWRSTGSSDTRRARSTGWWARRRARGDRSASRTRRCCSARPMRPRAASAVELEPLELEVHRRLTRRWPRRSLRRALRGRARDRAGARPGRGGRARPGLKR